MAGIGEAASIIAVIQITEEVIGFARKVKSASDDRQRLLIECSSLLGLLTTLKNFLLIDGEDDQDGKWQMAVRQLTIENGPLEQCNNALVFIAKKLRTESGFKKVGQALTWKFDREDILETLNQIERLKSLVGIAIELDHIKLSSAIRSDTSAILTAVKDIHQTTDAMEADLSITKAAVTRQQFNEVLQWICSFEYSTQIQDSMQKYQAGTGQWFLQHPLFSNWLRGKSDTLFCPGLPGAGKTILATLAVDHIQRLNVDASHVAVHVFCDYNKQTDQTLHRLLSSMLRQALFKVGSIHASVLQMYQTHTKNGTHLSLPEIDQALREISQSSCRLYAIVDGLDECEPRVCRALVSSLRQIATSANLKFLATSRYVPEIEGLFCDDPILPIEASEHDVQAYVRSRRPEFTVRVQKDTILLEQIEVGVIDAAKGMFLLAKLHMDGLVNEITPKAVKKALEQLPTGSQAYDSTYEAAMKRIVGQQRGRAELARSVLMWTVGAERSLTMEELQHALAIEHDESDLDHDNIADVDTIISVCAGLITVTTRQSREKHADLAGLSSMDEDVLDSDHESETSVEDERTSKSPSRSNRGIVRLIHFTTQEYLSRRRQQWFPDADFTITNLCLTYLSYETLKTGPLHSHWAVEKRLDYYPFLRYAAQYWGDHARHLECSREIEALVSGLQRYLAQPNLVASATQIDRRVGPGDSPKTNVTPLHVLARFGLMDLFRGFSISEHDTTAMDSEGHTPLFYAAFGGHATFADLLIKDLKAKVTIQDHYGRTALDYALALRHEAVAEVLLESGEVEATLQNGYLSSAIYNAVLSNSKQSTHLLALLLGIENADANYGRSLINLSYQDYQMDPLVAAVNQGDLDKVKMLLESGKTSSIPEDIDHSGTTAFEFAVTRKDFRMIKVLLERGISITRSNRNTGRGPLFDACATGNLKLFRLLLSISSATPAITARDATGRTPLSYAAQFGQKTLIELLLGSQMIGQDDYRADDFGRTPLSYAAESGSVESIHLLLHASRSDVDHQDDMGWTPLMYSQSANVAQILLKEGEACADARDKRGRSAMHMAAKAGIADIVQVLLEEGASHSLEDHKRRNPFSYAREACMSGLKAFKRDIDDDSISQEKTEIRNHHYQLMQSRWNALESCDPLDRKSLTDTVKLLSDIQQGFSSI